MGLTELIGLVTDIAGFSKSDRVKNNASDLNSASKDLVYVTMGRRSIKARTKDLILQYPMLTSTSISSDTALVVCRALEREYVNLITVLLNSEIADFEKDGVGSTEEYLKKFHTNIYRTGSLVEDATMSEWIKGNEQLLVPYEETINLNVVNELSFPTSVLTEARNNKGTTALGPVKTVADQSEELSRRKPLSNETEVLSKMDVKKMNDMSPTLIKTVIKVRDKGVGAMYEKSVLFGVKGVIHPLNSADIVFHLANEVKDSSKFFRLIQWTTGEIKLFRDLIASVDSVKADAVASVQKNNFWWRKLKSMGKDNIIRRFYLKTIGKNNKIDVPVPTATLIISKQDVDSIKNQYGVDLLSQPVNAMKVMRKLFLLGFVIVDESTNMAYILNETSKDYDYYTLNALKSFSKEETSDADVMKSLMKGR